MDVTGHPGAELVMQGLADLAEGQPTIEALLVAIGAPRLRRLGFEVPTRHLPEHELYEMLARTNPDTAHSRYNALLRRLTSFERAAECAA